MKGEYQTDRNWADQYMAEVQELLLPVVQQRTTIVLKIADFRRDTKQASDLITGVCGPSAFAVRLRRPGNFWNRSFNSPTHWGLQFTIRSMRDSGVETELAKFQQGFGDLFFYGHVEKGSAK
jgi:hypothetical protein